MNAKNPYRNILKRIYNPQPVFLNTGEKEEYKIVYDSAYRSQHKRPDFCGREQKITCETYKTSVRNVEKHNNTKHIFDDTSKSQASLNYFVFFVKFTVRIQIMSMKCGNHVLLEYYTVLHVTHQQPQNEK